MQEQDVADLIAGHFQTSRARAYELMKKALLELGYAHAKTDTQTAVAAERERYMQEIDRLRADRDLEKKWRKDAEHDREELIVAAIAAERERICLALPGGWSVDPQWVADMVRDGPACGRPGTSEPGVT